MQKFLTVFFAAMLFAVSANSLIKHAAGQFRGESLYDTKTVTTTTGWWLWKSETVSQVPLPPGAMDSSAMGAALLGMAVALFVLSITVIHFPQVVSGEVKVQEILPPMPKRKAKTEEGVAAVQNQDLTHEPEYARG